MCLPISEKISAGRVWMGALKHAVLGDLKRKNRLILGMGDVGRLGDCFILVQWSELIERGQNVTSRLGNKCEA